MYPSSSGTGGVGPSGSGAKKGINFSLEPPQFWDVHEIDYDGTERMQAPDNFPVYVARMARRIDWLSLVDSDKRYDNPNLLDLEDEYEYPEFEKELPQYAPEAGPWHPVAKHLHESLQQLNVLIDCIQVVRQTDYMKPLTVLDPVLMDQTTSVTDAVNISKASHWVWKRRSLNEAIEVLSISMRNRNLRDVSVDEAQHIRTKFFDELMALRNVWRIRKSGHRIYGDLGYHIFGLKYIARELFEIKRRDLTQSELENFRKGIPTSLIMVSVPKDLMRRSNLVLKIVRDEENAGLKADREEENYEYMKVRPAEAEKVYWRQALRWAQQTLVNRDVYEKLCTDAARMVNLNSVIRENALFHSLFDGLFLKVELKYYPFRVGELKEPDNDPFLARILQQIVVKQECTRYSRPQIFVSMPLTTMPEELDLRGSKAFTKADINDFARKPQRLLDKIGKIAGHQYLSKLVNRILLDYQKHASDPSIQWRFIRISSTSSQVAIVINYRGFESLTGRHPFTIMISHDRVEVVTKDSQTVNCFRDPSSIRCAIKMQIITANVTAATSLSRYTWHYSVMHTNMNAMQKERKLPAPTVHLCNEPSTRSIFIEFPIDADPVISVRKFPHRSEEEDDAEHQFTRYDYNKLPGSTLCRKMDFVFSLFKN